MQRLGAILAVVVLGAGLWACDDGGAGEPAQMGGAGGADAGQGGEGGAGGEGGMAMAARPASGLWFVNFRLVEVGDLEIAFQVELAVGESDGGGDQIDTFTLRAIGVARSVSDALFTVTDLPIVDGTFTLPAQTFVLPGAYSPTGSDVDLILGMAFTVRGPDDMCGALVGDVVTIGTALEESTFAAVPWGTEPTAPAAACDDGPPAMLPRRVDCPAITAGRNTGFMSAGIERAFTVFLPTDHDPGQSTPVVFLYHGLTSNADAILDATQMADFVDDLGFILVVPESYPEGAIEWDTASAADSPDLAFFDDLQRCTISALGGDPARMYTAGLSAGSFQSVYLGLYRAETVAASVGFSTGLIAPVRQDAPPHPFLTAWGGPDDTAFDQNFEVLTGALNAELRALGHPVITCDHGQLHVWDADFTPWALQFLFAHALGDGLAFEALPDSFPDHCRILP